MGIQNISKDRQDIHGIVLLDKPTGMSSNKALQIVKRAFNAKKAGHTGALDPLATGLLPLCFGQATKLADYLLGQNKTYLVTAELGKRTTTSDSEGELIESRDIPSLTADSIENYLNAFRGEIMQTPSMYSALKFQGKPYYYYARKGIEIERVTRPVTIYSCDLVDFTKMTLTLRVQCSKGTYIRTLIDDLGELIGCGAHVCALRREQIEGIQGKMVSLDMFETIQDGLFESCMLAPETVIDCELYTLSDTELEALRIGTLKSVTSKISSNLIALKSSDNIVFAYAQKEANDEFIISRRFIHGFGTVE